MTKQPTVTHCANCGFFIHGDESECSYCLAVAPGIYASITERPPRKPMSETKRLLWWMAALATVAAVLWALPPGCKLDTTPNAQPEAAVGDQ